LIEGPHLLGDALALGADIERVFILEGDAVSLRLSADNGVPVHTVSEEAMRRIAGTAAPRGPVAVLEIPATPIPEGGDVLVAWGVSDPGNVGMLVRIAAGFGWAFAYSPGTSDPWAPKTLRSGAGGHFRTTISSVGTVAELRGRTLLASAVGGGTPPRAHSGPVALLVGDEGSGLPVEVVEACDEVLSIEMPGGIESLNVAVAAGILVYELTPDR
jgi:TrmH family RNA methyltransferase